MNKLDILRNLTQFVGDQHLFFATVSRTWKEAWGQRGGSGRRPPPGSRPTPRCPSCCTASNADCRSASSDGDSITYATLWRALDGSSCCVASGQTAGVLGTRAPFVGLLEQGTSTSSSGCWKAAVPGTRRRVLPRPREASFPSCSGPIKINVPGMKKLVLQLPKGATSTFCSGPAERMPLGS